MATVLLGLIKGLYHSVGQQREVVEDQKASLEFLKMAHVLIDATLEEEAEQLETAHGILDDLDDRLGQAISLWSQLPTSEKEQEELPWPQFPEPNPEPESRRATVPRFKTPRHPKQAKPSLSDPAVGSEARYTQQWNVWTEGRTVPFLATIHRPRGVSWWMQEKNHYGLCQPLEQTQLENSADAVQFSRTYAPPPHAPTVAPTPASMYNQSFAQQVRQAQNRQYQLPAPPLPPLYGVQLSFRRARANSSDFWLDEDFEPDFWQKNLRPGNIWTDPPRYPVPKSDPVSPKTIPRDLRTNNLERVVAAKTFERSVAEGLQVGGTCPSSYFPRPKKQDFRALTSDNSRRY